MDLEDGVMTGRPHGGTAVLWRKSLTAYPVSNVDKSIVGINIKCQNISIVIISGGSWLLLMVGPAKQLLKCQKVPFVDYSPLRYRYCSIR